MVVFGQSRVAGLAMFEEVFDDVERMLDGGFGLLRELGLGEPQLVGHAGDSGKRLRQDQQGIANADD